MSLRRAFPISLSFLALTTAFSIQATDDWKPPPAFALTICFTDPPLAGEKSPCALKEELPADLAKMEMFYIPESAFRVGQLEAALCSVIGNRKDARLEVLLMGKISQGEDHSEMDWVSRDGRPGAGGKIPVWTILDLYGRCLERSQAKRRHTLVKGCLAGGDRWDLSQPNAFPNSVTTNSGIATLFCDGSGDGMMEHNLRYDTQRAAANHFKGAKDPWNLDEDDIPLTISSPENPLGCRNLWQALLHKNPATVLNEDPTGMPGTSACTTVPAILKERHDDYARACGPKSEGTTDEDRASGCRLAFIYYLASLRRWSSRDRAPASLNGVEEVAENLIWATTGVPVGKDARRREISERLARRLLELRPQSGAAAGYVLDSVLPQKDDSPREAYLAVRGEALKALELYPSLTGAGRMQVAYRVFTALTEGGKRNLAEQLARDWARDPKRAAYLEELHSYIARNMPTGSHPHAIELMRDILK